MKVLAISGWKKSGKDTATDHLVAKYGASRVSFAGPLKDKVAEDFNIPREWLDDQDKKEKPILTLPVSPQDDFSLNVVRFMFKEFRTEKGEIPHFFDEKLNMGVITFGGQNQDNYILEKLYQTPRSLAILEGSTKRAADPGYWVNQAVLKICNKSANQPIEQYKKSVNVITDMRYKSEASQIKKAFPGNQAVIIRINRFDISPSQDPSERDMDNYEFDYVIENRGTLEEFYRQVDAVMKDLK